MPEEVEPSRSSSEHELERASDREDLKIAQRLRELRKALKLKQSEVAQKLGQGFNRGKIGRFERGNQPLEQDFLKRLTEVFNANPDWLLTGNGEMRRHVGIRGQISIGTQVTEYPPTQDNSGVTLNEHSPKKWHEGLSTFEEHTLRRVLDILRSRRAKTRQCIVGNIEEFHEKLDPSEKTLPSSDE